MSDVKPFKYAAFISYRHTRPDKAVAERIHYLLETYKIPKEIQNEKNIRHFRVFRDREELSVGDLDASLKEALMQSEFLIVICSKRTPLSEWCVREVELFKQYHGEQNIIPVLIEGEPEESFSEPLKSIRPKDDSNAPDPANEHFHLLAADLRPKKTLDPDFAGYEELENQNSPELTQLTKESLHLLKSEKYRILARMLDCNLGDLVQRERLRKNRLYLSIAGIISASMLVFGMLMFHAYTIAENARKEAVRSGAAILLGTAKNELQGGDRIKALLVSKEAMNMLDPGTKGFDQLNARYENILYDSVYIGGSAPLTTINTKNNLTFYYISKDESMVAHGYDNNLVAVSDPKTGQLIRTFDGHSQIVKNVSLSDDNRYLLSSAFDSRLLVHDVNSGEALHEFSFEGTPMGAMFSQDQSKILHMSLSNEGYEFFIADVNSREILNRLTVNDTSLINAVFSPDADKLITNSGTSVLLWDMQTGEMEKDITKDIFQSFSDDDFSLNNVKSVQYIPNTEDVFILFFNKLICYRTSENRILYSVETDLYFGSSLRFGSDNTTVNVGNGNRIDVYHVETGELQKSLSFSRSMDKFAYSAGSNTAFGVDSYGYFEIWKDGGIIKSGNMPENLVPTDLNFIDNGATLLYNLRENQNIHIMIFKSDSIEKAYLGQLIGASPDRSKFAVALNNRCLIYDDNLQLLHRIPLDVFGKSNFQTLTTRYVITEYDFILSNDGNYLAVPDADETKRGVFLYNIAKQEQQVINTGTRFESIAFSHDSRYMYMINRRDGLRILDLETMKVDMIDDTLKESDLKLRPSTDGKYLVVEMVPVGSILYDLENHKEIARLTGSVMHVEKGEQGLKAIGIYNNSGYTWNETDGVAYFDLDSDLSDTPVGFKDIVEYNAATNRVLIIRNIEKAQKAYLIDFTTGNLLMRFDFTLNFYTAKGYINSAGNKVIIDHSTYDNSYSKDSNSANVTSMDTGFVYEILNSGEVHQMAEKLIGNRTLSAEEKRKIGIQSEQ